MNLDLARPMISLRAMTPHTQTRFANLRGVAGPTQTQAEQSGGNVLLRTLVDAAASYGFAIEVKTSKRLRPLAPDGAAPPVSVDGFAAVCRVVDVEPNLRLRPLAADDPPTLRALNEARVAREAAAAETAAQVALGDAPMTGLEIQIAAWQREAEAGGGSSLESTLWAARPKTLAAFRALLSDSQRAVFDGRLAPLARGERPANREGVTRQADNAIERRLSLNLKWLGLTLGDGARR